MGKSGKKLHYEGSSFHRVSLDGAANSPCTYLCVDSLVKCSPGLISIRGNPFVLELLSGWQLHPSVSLHCLLCAC